LLSWRSGDGWSVSRSVDHAAVSPPPPSSVDDATGVMLLAQHVK